MREEGGRGEEGGREGEGGERVVCDTIEDKESIKKKTTNFLRPKDVIDLHIR